MLPPAPQAQPHEQVPHECRPVWGSRTIREVRGHTVKRKGSQTPDSSGGTQGICHTSLSMGFRATDTCYFPNDMRPWPDGPSASSVLAGTLTPFSLDMRLPARLAQDPAPHLDKPTQGTGHKVVPPGESHGPACLVLIQPKSEASTPNGTPCQLSCSWWSTVTPGSSPATRGIPWPSPDQFVGAQRASSPEN